MGPLGSQGGVGENQRGGKLPTPTYRGCIAERPPVLPHTAIKQIDVLYGVFTGEAKPLLKVGSFEKLVTGRTIRCTPDLWNGVEDWCVADRKVFGSDGSKVVVRDGTNSCFR
jgi:hypothetical protein